MARRTSQELDMFIIENYKFSTGQDGRETTMYFSNGIDGGRIKRSKSIGGDGGMIIYQKGCKRVFLNFYESLRISGMGEDAISMKMEQKVIKVYEMLLHDKADDRTKLLYSLAPKVGWRVFEFFGDRMHGSAGTVVASDSDANPKKIFEMMNDDAMISV
jgi:hypothetical protein